MVRRQRVRNGLIPRSFLDDPAIVASAGTHGRLTKREREVMLLLAAGHPNRKIADLLFISEKTVEKHVTSILAKLDVPSRAAAAAYAARHGLA